MKARHVAIGLLWIALLAPGGRAQEAGQKRGEPKPSSCTNCHRKQSGRLATVVSEWARSTHAHVGVGCESCHGGDVNNEELAHSIEKNFVAKPRIRETSYFCGKCHEAIKEKHLGSPHGAQGLPSCVGCHGSHAIGRPDPEKIIVEKACSTCHSFDPAAKSLASLGKARSLVEELRSNVAILDHLPAAKRHLVARQKEMKLDREGVVATFHSFRIGDIEMIGMNAERLKKIIGKLHERETLLRNNVARERPFILLLGGFFLLATYLGYIVFYGKGEVNHGKSEEV